MILYIIIITAFQTQYNINKKKVLELDGNNDDGRR